MRYNVIRYIEYNVLFERFFISSIFAIIAIRLYLYLAGYPQIGGGGLHIAHMLWGGALMVVALIGFMLFLNDDFKPIFSVIAGLGFGTFIDELGKFITQDNNYFYQPTFAIIYVLFVCMFMLSREIRRRSVFTKSEYLANSLDKLKEVVISDLDKSEQKLALEYLEKSDAKNSLVVYLKKSFSELKDIKDAKLSLYEKLKRNLSTIYDFIKSKTWFLKAVTFLFLFRAMTHIVHGYFLAVLLFSDGGTWYGNVQLGAIIVMALFTALGVISLKRSRLWAFRHFKSAILISILVIQVFNFYRQPTVAFLSTVFDILILSSLNFMLEKEYKK